MNFSKEQTDIFDWFQNSAGNLVIEAFAGTGKTTTIKEAFQYAPENRILYAVFNKKNQIEAKGKISDGRVDIRTLHSLGFSYIKSVYPSAKPDDSVEWGRIESALNGFNASRETISAIFKTVSFAKNTKINPSLNDIHCIIDDRDIDIGNELTEIEFAEHVLEVLRLSKEHLEDWQHRISFDDMVWLPVALDIVKPRYDLVVVDEAQDMNIPQLTMAKLAAKGRIVVVGDSRQAIYGFRGAVQNGMGMMTVTLQAKKLLLSTTYRCPKVVVREAQKIVPQYQAAPSAPTGRLESVKSADGAQIGDVILSRLNAPLMPLALRFLRRGTPARIEGRDIGAQLLTIVQSLKATSLEDFTGKLDTWKNKQLKKLTGKRNFEKKIEQINDIAETLSALADDAQSVIDIGTKISNLFQDSKANSIPAVLLSTVHKAKGLEWDTVYLLRDTFLRENTTEEQNIYYVAVTRAKKNLWIVADAAQEVVKPTSPIGIKDTGTVVPEYKPSTYDLPAGLIFFRRGDVIKFERKEYVCEMVNSCRARFVNIQNRSDLISISATTEPSRVLRKLSENDLTNFLAPAQGQETNTKTGEVTHKNMSRTKSEKGSALEQIIELVKSGKTVDAITKELTKTRGEVSPSVAYIIGREWRREHDQLGKGRGRKAGATNKVAIPTAKTGNKTALKAEKKSTTPTTAPVKAKKVSAPPKATKTPPKPKAEKNASVPIAPSLPVESKVVIEPADEDESDEDSE